MIRRLSLALLGPLLAPAAPLPAQMAPDSGAFVIRHGRDTVATERFSRTATHLEGTLQLRDPSRTSQRYSAVVAPDATLPLIEITVREGVDSGLSRAKVRQRARVIFKEDSAAVDEVGQSGLVTRVFGTDPGAMPYLNLSFALLEQAVRRARAANGGSQVPFFNLEGDKPWWPSWFHSGQTRCRWISVTPDFTCDSIKRGDSWEEEFRSRTWWSKDKEA